MTCTCPQPALDDEPPLTTPTLRRVASYPRCHPNFDPHRFSLHFDGLEPQNIHSLRQLPTVPPSGGLPGQLFWPNYHHHPQSSLQPPNHHHLHLLRPLTHYSSTQDFVKKQHQQPSNSSSQLPLRRLQHRNASFPVFNGLIEASVASKSAAALAAMASNAAEAGHGESILLQKKCNCLGKQHCVCLKG